MYERKRHPFTPKDLLRIQRKILAEAEEPSKIEDPVLWYWLLIEILDELTEWMVSYMLAPVGMSWLADDIVEGLQDRVELILERLSDYWKEARGPLGIPWGGVL